MGDGAIGKLSGNIEMVYKGEVWFRELGVWIVAYLIL